MHRVASSSLLRRFLHIHWHEEYCSLTLDSHETLHSHDLTDNFPQSVCEYQNINITIQLSQGLPYYTSVCKASIQ